MKQAISVPGMIPTSNDLDFESRTKAYAIEQGLYDLLDQQTVYAKGVIKSSGLTSSHENDPLKVYITSGTTVNIYSGIAYDGYEGRSQRIFVPDAPADVPLSDAEAHSNYDNIDMPDETRSRDFSTADRPPRTNIKTFTAADADGTYYVCLRHTYGDYDPIVIPNDGSVEDSKRYDSYIIYVSAYTAAQLFAMPAPLGGYPWLQLASLSWDGAQLLITADDRVYASCTVSVTDVMVKQHQDLLHENGIISEDHTKLLCSIDNGALQIVFADPVFTSSEGILVNGTFVQSIAPLYVQFDLSMATNNYYIYLDSAGIPRASTSLIVAEAGVVLCRCYFDAVAGRLQLGLNQTEEKVRDLRRFGSIGKYQLSSKIVGTTYDYTNDLKVEEISDEVKDHRGYAHGNGLVITAAAPYAAGVGSLGSTIVGAVITINDISVGDKLFIGGLQATSRVEVTGSITFTAAMPANTYYFYATLGTDTQDPNHQYELVYSIVDPRSNNRNYPICMVDWSGVAFSSLVDMRVYGTVGYAHIQRNRNASGFNSLPQPMVCLYGNTPALVPVGASAAIYLTDDWGTGYAGGGTITGNRVFAIKPMIMVYSSVVTYGTDGFGGDISDAGVVGYSLTEVTETSFKIWVYANQVAQPYYWIAVGPGSTNAITTVLKGKANPYY